MDDVYEEILRLRARGEPAALAIVVATQGSTPREEGAKMLVCQDGSIIGTVGGSVLEGQVIEKAKTVIREQKVKLCDFDLTGRGGGTGMICGGTARVYIEPIIPEETSVSHES
jgi:xanthine dehydrogenase accessory factor